MAPWGRAGPRRFCCWRGRVLDSRPFQAAEHHVERADKAGAGECDSARVVLLENPPQERRQPGLVQFVFRDGDQGVVELLLDCDAWIATITLHGP